MDFSASVNCINTSSIQLEMSNLYHYLNSNILVYMANNTYGTNYFKLFDKIITTYIYVNVDDSKYELNPTSNNINLKYEYSEFNGISALSVHNHKVWLILKNINKNTKINLNISYKNIEIKDLDLFVKNYNIKLGNDYLNIFDNSITIIINDNMLNTHKLHRLYYNTDSAYLNQRLFGRYGSPENLYNLYYNIASAYLNQRLLDHYGSPENKAAKVKYRKCFNKKVSCINNDLIKFYTFNDLLKYCHNKKRIIRIIYMLVNNGFPYELLCIYLKYIITFFIIFYIIKRLWYKIS